MIELNFFKAGKVFIQKRCMIKFIFNNTRLFTYGKLYLIFHNCCKKTAWRAEHVACGLNFCVFQNFIPYSLSIQMYRFFFSSQIFMNNFNPLENGTIADGAVRKFKFFSLNSMIENLIRIRKTTQKHLNLNKYWKFLMESETTPVTTRKLLDQIK